MELGKRQVQTNCHKGRQVAGVGGKVLGLIALLAMASTMAGCAKLPLEEQLKGLSPVDEILTRVKYTIEEISLYDEEIAKKALNAYKVNLVAIGMAAIIYIDEKKACLDRKDIYKYFGAPSEENFDAPPIIYDVYPEHREEFAREFHARPKRPGYATAFIEYRNLGKYNTKLLFSYRDYLCVQTIYINQFGK